MTDQDQLRNESGNPKYGKLLLAEVFSSHILNKLKVQVTQYLWMISSRKRMGYCHIFVELQLGVKGDHLFILLVVEKKQMHANGGASGMAEVRRITIQHRLSYKKIDVFCLQEEAQI
ncbi:hypothetical protein ACJX0J_028067, partial [Zea mays]